MRSRRGSAVTRGGKSAAVQGDGGSGSGPRCTGSRAPSASKKGAGDARGARGGLCRITVMRDPSGPHLSREGNAGPYTVVKACRDGGMAMLVAHAEGNAGSR